MAQREGSVYLYLFVATFILFIGMIVLFFLENGKTNVLETAIRVETKKVEEEKGRADKYNGLLGQLRKLVGGPEAVEAWPGNDVYEGKLKEAEAFVNDMYKKLDNKAPKTYENMYAAYIDFKEIIQKILDTRKRAEELGKRADEEKLAALTQTKVETTKLTEQIGQLKSQGSETESRYEKRVSDLTRDGERLQRELASTRDEMASKEIDAKRALAVGANLINSLRTRLDKLEEEKRRVKGIEDVEPDGQILEIVGTAQIGWVDIGRKNHLRPGLDFQVYQVIKGGKRQLKGRVEIQQVEESVSRFRILEVADDLNPITKGDLITSPFYDPKAVPVFVFAGKGLESKDITEESLKAKIKSYGAQIKDEVDLSTSFLIALKDYDTEMASQALYKSARDLGVPVLREKDILEFIGR